MYITEHCSLLINLGDTVLADRGFDISDSYYYYSTPTAPAYTMGRSQLSGNEVEQTRRIANVRIHVVRVIGNIGKKYLLLSVTQPIHFFISPDDSISVLDKIVHVCCALINICDSVVPFDFKSLRSVLQLLTSLPFTSQKFSTAWTVPIFYPAREKVSEAIQTFVV